jgi:hypothetical protein
MTFLSAAATCLGAPLAMIMFMPFTFGGAAITEIRA